jgi:IS1 family transposase/transposase-like protein
MLEFWMHEVALMLFVWVIAHHYQYWSVIGFLKKTPPQLQPPSPQVGKKPEQAKKEFQGLTVKPVCNMCEQAEEKPVMSRVPPPLIVPKKGRPKSVATGLQFCPHQACDYYGWAGRGNISANGHPNGGRNRQLYCCVCQSWYMETTGTLFYRKQYPAEQITQAIACLAEGLGIRAVGRVFDVTPETILDWLAEAVVYLEIFNTYMTHNLEVKQVQWDELYGVIRAYQTGELSEAEAMAKLDNRRKRIWVWTAMDPISKYWLAFEIGDRTAANAWKIVHKVATVLKKGLVPLLLTDGNRAYEHPILSHYGEWQEPAAGQRKPRWFPLADLLYAQVVKKRRGRRLVSVSKKVIFGSLTRLNETLEPLGWTINTAFVERLNLTIRHLVPGLGRRVNTLLHSPQSLARQVCLAQTYYNFCQPAGSLQIAPTQDTVAQSRTPAMAIGITSHVWTLQEVLRFKPPPFPQEN